MNDELTDTSGRLPRPFMNWLEVDSREELSARAAEILLTAIREHPTAVLGLPTGRTPLGIVMRSVLNLAMGQCEIRLDPANPSGNPIIEFRMLEDELDRRRLREAVRLCVRLGGHPAFNGILGDRLNPGDADLASDAALDAWMRREITHTHHLSGT